MIYEFQLRKRFNLHVVQLKSQHRRKRKLNRKTMWPYWMLFLVPALQALFEKRTNICQMNNQRPDRNLGISITGVLIALMVGFRFEVGGDWLNYLNNFEQNGWISFSESLAMRDPFYRLLEVISYRLGWGVYGVNGICGAIFTYGLVSFCRSQPRPWLSLTVAVPYLVIVLGMGYTRQGVALGCIMAGLPLLIRGRTFAFVIWVILATGFHQSAIIALPFAALASVKGRFWTTVWVGSLLAIAYVQFLSDEIQRAYQNYILEAMQSEGALVRLAMNAVAASVLLGFWHRFLFQSETERRLWFWFAVGSFVGLLAFYFSPSSTSVDRIALYCMPIQLTVASRFPEAFGIRSKPSQILVVIPIGVYALVEYVWLNFATWAPTWIPYKTLLI